MRRGDLEPVEHRTDIVTGAILRVAVGILRHFGWRVAAGIVGDAAITPGKVADLRLEAAIVVGEFMDEDDRSA